MRRIVVAFVSVWALAGFVLAGSAISDNARSPSIASRINEPCGGGNEAVYVSEGGEILTACFDNRENTVLVKPPEGEAVKLPLAISGSGARYSDGRRTFWEHQGEGSYWVGETLVFRGKAK